MFARKSINQSFHLSSHSNRNLHFFFSLSTQKLKKIHANIKNIRETSKKVPLISYYVSVSVLFFLFYFAFFKIKFNSEKKIYREKRQKMNTYQINVVVVVVSLTKKSSLFFLLAFEKINFFLSILLLLFHLFIFILSNNEWKCKKKSVLLRWRKIVLYIYVLSYVITFRFLLSFSFLFFSR